MGSVTVDRWDVGSWSFVAVDDIEEATITQRVGTSEAVFTVAPATVADRLALRHGRQVHVTITQGSDQVGFHGYVEKPKVLVDGPETFRLAVTCVGYVHLATRTWIDRIEYFTEIGPAYPYTWIITDLWSSELPGVDRTKVVAGAKTLPLNEMLAFQYVSLAQATNSLIAYLDDYVWWLEYDAVTDTDYLRVEPKGNTVSGKTFGENDIRASYELEPLFSDVRNAVTVIGGQGGGDDPLNPGTPSDLSPVKGWAESIQSAATFGSRYLMVKDPSIDTNDQAEDRAETEVTKRAWPTWRGEFVITDFGLRVGEKVTLDMPTIGIDGSNFGKLYISAKLVDHYKRGVVRRRVVFEEIVPPVLS